MLPAPVIAGLALTRVAGGRGARAPRRPPSVVAGRAHPAGGRPAPAIAGPRQWIATTVATAVSTYALDAVATAAGVALVASGLLTGLHAPLPLVFLVATYAAWACGLRANLAANWALLHRTGTSTNLFSKVAHDLARARRAGAKARRLAASAGYVATEVAKEAPYYAGASGAVLLSDAVAATDAALFFGGANLGAAAYELGLARATRRFLARR